MRELFINHSDNKNLIYLIEEGRIVEYYEEGNEHKNLDGNIYIGKVQNIVPRFRSCFYKFRGR